MKRTSELVSDLQPSGIRDFFELVMGMDDVISLGVGEPDFVTPWHIRNSAIQSIEDGYTNYTSNKGLMELRETLSQYLEKRHNISYVPEDELLVTTGVSEAMDLAMRAIINPGDEVIIPDPCYISYVPTAKMAGGKVNRVKTTYENQFKLDAEDLADTINPSSKVLCLNYPANPTGVTYREDTLRKLGRIVVENDLIVISDEIYSELTFGQDHVPLASLEGLKNHTVYLNGFSKAHAMTGFRIGYAAGPGDIISTMTKVHQYTMLSAPTPSQFGAIEALINGDRAVENMKEEYRKRRDLVVQRFHEMGLDCIEPEGSFYAFPSIASTELDAQTFCEKLLDQQKVAVVPGPAFGDSGENHVRVSFATDLENLHEALNRIERFLDDLKTLEINPDASVAAD